MAMIKFWRGLQAKYTALTAKDEATLYFLTDAKEIYLGTKLIAKGNDDALNALIASLDAEVKGEGTYVDVTVTEADGKITGVTIDDSAIDTKLSDYVLDSVYQKYLTTQAAKDKGQDDLISGLRADLNEITEVGGEPNKVDDVKVNGNSVVVDKVANIDLTGKEDVGVAAGLIANLGADVTSAAVEAGKGIQVNVKEAAGKITEVVVSGNYDNTYDAKGAAATAEQNAKDYTDGEITGLEFALSEDGKTLELKNKAGTAVATLDTTDFVVDGMLTSVVADQANNKLTFTWNTVSGIEETEIELSSIADIYTGSTNANEVNVVVSNANEISATIGANVKTSIAKGVEAYGWGDHAKAGYAAASDVTTLSGKVGTLEGKVDVEKVSTAIATAIAAEQLGTMAKETAADYVKKADAPGYNDIMTKTAHNTFVSGNAALQSGITAAKVSGYDATKTTVDTNKATWDKAGTAVQPAAIADMLTKTEAATTYQPKGNYEAAGAAAAVQGATTNTVKDCVDAINTVNNLLIWIEG